MHVSLSKSSISSFAGDVLPLYLCADSDLGNATITWQAKGDCVAIRHFDHDENTPFSNGVLISLLSPGTATVTALFEQNTYTCDVHVRARQTASETDALHFFRGDLHVHPAKTHDPETFAAEPRIQRACIEQIKNEALLDFSVLSDHACVMYGKGFFDTFKEKELAEPMSPVLFPGSESEVTIIEPDRFGIQHQHSGELVVLNADACSFGESWQDFMDRMAQSPLPVGIFAHPLVFGADGLWSYPFDEIRYPELYRLMRGIELGRGSLVGYDIIYEYAYSDALDNGFSVSPTCGSDCHGPHWGFHSMPAKTIVMATEKSREAFLDALRCNRFYACESGNVKLHYTVNGVAAPAKLTPCPSYAFHVSLSLFENTPDTMPTHCEVISDHGEVVHTCEKFGDTIDFALCSSTARYFYLRLWDEKGRKTWSAPIWTGREFDQPREKELPLIPLDGAKFSAIDTITGKDASAALVGLPSNAFESSASTARIVIDMKEKQTICALGHWGKHTSKTILREQYGEWKPFARQMGRTLLGGYTTRYAISTSLDGKEYALRATGRTHSFADEEIVRFEPCEARFVCFEVLSTVGKDSHIPELRNVPVNVGSLAVFTK